MTTTAFKIDLMLPAMGMNRFTSHSRTPTTIRANTICMRGILFYLSVYAARHFFTDPTNCYVPCLDWKTCRIASIQRRARLTFQTDPVIDVLFEVFSARAGVEIKPKGMD
jgi:hypothetical protein